MNLSFLYPAFLAGAAAIALPIILHLLRRDVAPDVPFTAVRLLRRSPVERVHNRRLKDLLLLAARVIALLLLAVAFARPYVQGAVPAPVRVVAIDRSYSMGGPGRFDRARALARAAVDEAPGGERVAVVAFDDRADVLAAPGSKADARAALDRLAIGFGTTRYPALFEKTLEIAAGAGGRLVIVTDLQPSGWSADGRPAVPGGWDVDIRDVGALPANLSVVAAAVEPASIVATIRNAGQSARSGRVRAAVDDLEVSSADFTVGAGETAAVRMAQKAPAGGALRVSIEDPDGLPADDARYLVLGAQGAARALVVTAGGESGLFLSRALETSRGETVDVVANARLASMTSGELSGYSMIALLSTRGLDRKSRETMAAHVRGGAGLFVAAASEVDPSVLASMTDWKPALSVVDEAQNVTLAATDVRHPIVRPLGALAANLGQIRFERSWRVAPDGWSVVARFSSGSPALLERSLGAGRVVLFASDVDRRWNDFPLHPAFVPFAIETARYLTAGSPNGRHAREYTVAQAPAGVGPDPGVFRAGDNRTVAVNVDPAEGALDRMTAAAFDQKIQRDAAAGQALDVQAHESEARQSYWQYGLALMLLALAAESFVGRS